MSRSYNNSPVALVYFAETWALSSAGRALPRMKKAAKDSEGVFGSERKITHLDFSLWKLLKIRASVIN